MKSVPIRTEHAAGKAAIKMALSGRGQKVDGFVATVFGRIYEDLLNYYFSRQGYTDRRYATWRPGGVAWVQRAAGATKVRQDFLLESPVAPGNGPSGHRLVCFEAKSWPAYDGLGYLTPKNVPRFLRETSRFVEDTRRQPTSWILSVGDGPEQRRKPDSFGYLVFDYDLESREEILHAIAQEAPEITELESITGLLSMVLYNGKLKDDRLSLELRTQLDAANGLFNLFI